MGAPANDADLAPLSYTVKEALKVTGYGKTRLYELIAAGKLDARRDGHKTVIMAESVRVYLAGLPKWSPARAA